MSQTAYVSSRLDIRQPSELFIILRRKQIAGFNLHRRHSVEEWRGNLLMCCCNANYNICQCFGRHRHNHTWQRSFILLSHNVAVRKPAKRQLLAVDLVLHITVLQLNVVGLFVAKWRSQVILFSSERWRTKNTKLKHSAKLKKMTLIDRRHGNCERYE